MRSLLIFTALVAAAPALADDCAAAYTTDQLLADLVVAEQGLRGGQDQMVGLAGGNLEKGLPCLGEMLPQMMVGKTYRAIAAGRFLNNDEAGAKLWFSTALEVDSTFIYGVQDIPADHPMRTFYSDVKRNSSTEPVPVEGMGFIAGKHYLDGRLWDTPKATLGVPHLYQHEANTIHTWMITGNNFPPEMLQDPSTLPPEAGRDTPEGYVRMEGGYAVAYRSPIKTPLIATGIVALLAGGGVYGYSFLTRAEFDEASDLAEVERTETLTNNLVLASGGLAVLGLSTFTWGVAIDGQNRGIRMRRAF